MLVLDAIARACAGLCSCKTSRHAWIFVPYAIVFRTAYACRGVDPCKHNRAQITSIGTIKEL